MHTRKHSRTHQHTHAHQHTRTHTHAPTHPHAHCRGGTLLWNRQSESSNSVVFIFAGTFTRSYMGFRRGGLTSLPNVGDTLVLTGKEPIVFKPGSSLSEDGVGIRLQVTEIDEQEDWLKGVWTHEHTYATPSNQGAPWAARITGCCRYSGLSAQADTPFQMIASVDLNWKIGYTPAKGSGHIPSVSVLHTFAGPPPLSPRPRHQTLLQGSPRRFCGKRVLKTDSFCRTRICRVS